MWWGQYNRPMALGQVRGAVRADAGLPAGAGRICAGRVRGRRRAVPAAGADRDRIGLAELVCAQHVPDARNRWRNTQRFVPEFTIFALPDFKAAPAVDNTASETFICLSFEKKLAIIGNTAYAGEIKKSVFTILNYLLPLEGVLSMHCSANVSPDDPDDVALFFGLSGTGKTTLSADPSRRLIGDDEHGWSDSGVFNFEGGCYAKVIGLSASAEPEIYATTHMFGTLLENVTYDPVTRLH